MADDYLQSGMCWWNAGRTGNFSGAATMSAAATSVVSCSGATPEASSGSGGGIFGIDESGSASVGSSITFQDSHKPQLMDSTMQIPTFSLSTPTMDWNQALIRNNSRSENSYHAMHQDDLTSRTLFANSAGDSSSNPYMDMNQSFILEHHDQLSSGQDPSFPLPSTSYYDGRSANYSSPMTGCYRPTNQLHFSNNTAYWNAPAANAASEEARSVFYSSMPAPTQIFDHKLSSNLNTKLNTELGSSSVKKSCINSSNSEPVFKKTRIETPSPLPTFKVRKEKLGDRITALQQLVSPFGKTDTASVLHEAIEYIKFLHDQVNVLSTPYLKNGHPMQHHQTSEGEGSNKDLRSRGLCLVPVASTYPVASEIPADFWTPTFGGTYR